MSKVESTMDNFVKNIKSTAIFSIAPLTIIYNSAKSKLWPLTVLAVLALPLLIAITGLTLPLGILAGVLQCMALPFMLLNSKIEDYNDTKNLSKPVSTPKKVEGGKIASENLTKPNDKPEHHPGIFKKEHNDKRKVHFAESVKKHDGPRPKP